MKITKKYPSQKRNKICKLCKNKNKKYSSSSLGRHIRTMHGQKYQCPYCLKKYREKNNHRTCFLKERYLLKLFIDTFQNNLNTTFNTNSIIKDSNLSYFFIEDNHTLQCPKLKLGQGHFSKVYYGIDKLTRKEIAIKVARNKIKNNDYQNEGKIITLLQGDNFYPILYNYNDSIFLDKLEMTLFGPNLLDLFSFCNGFDKKTILNIFENLLHKIKYLSEKKIIHRDIKPENIVWGRMNNSKILNKDELFLIDYGFSLNIKEISNYKRNEKHHYRCGTTRYMSISNHNNEKPSILDDIESLLYSVMYLAQLDLPWINEDSLGSQKHLVIMEMKSNLDLEKSFGQEFEFLCQVYIYLNKVRTEKKKLDFEIIFEFINLAKKKKVKFFHAIKRNLYLLKKIKAKLYEFRLSGSSFPNDEKLIRLFHSYPVDYNKLSNSLT